MKKLVLGLLGLGLLSVNITLFAMNCGDSLGVWRGSLPPLTSVNLVIHHPDILEDAAIAFIDPNHAHVQYGLLHLSCQAEVDGSVLLTFSREAYGANVNLTARMSRPNELHVINFSYGDNISNGKGSGILHRG